MNINVIIRSDNASVVATLDTDNNPTLRDAITMPHVLGYFHVSADEIADHVIAVNEADVDNTIIRQLVLSAAATNGQIVDLDIAVDMEEAGDEEECDDLEGAMEATESVEEFLGYVDVTIQGSLTTHQVPVVASTNLAQVMAFVAENGFASQEQLDRSTVYFNDSEIMGTAAYEVIQVAPGDRIVVAARAIHKNG